MKIKKFMMICLIIVLSLGTASINALAYSEENTVQEAETTEETEVEEAESESAEDVQEEPAEPLTPDGNLTLMDDAGSTSEAGKQFITLVTKNGNYFYLIIDRDDEGEETVHFLNQVDEADLLSLMDDEEAAKYQESQEPEEVEEEPEITEPVMTEPETVTEAEPEKETSAFNPIPALIILALMIAGGGTYLFLQMKKKKQALQEKPDPDADYQDYEEDEIELPDEEDEY